MTEESKNVFFPIDGFNDANLEKLLEAWEELALALEKMLGGKVKKLYLDINTRSVSI